MKFKALGVITLLMFSCTSFSEELTASKEYRNILKNYTKILFEESCYSRPNEGCVAAEKEHLSEKIFEQAFVGEYTYEGIIYYYVVVPDKKGMSSTAMFSRKSPGDALHLCGLEESMVSYNEQIKNIKSVDYNSCISEF